MRALKEGEVAMPRLFTGFEVPPDIAGQLAAVRGGLTGARWITPDHYHVTLRFFGDIDGATARDIDAMLVLLDKPALRLTVTGLRIFGGERPRALVAEIESTPDLLEMQAEQERLVRRLGLPPETRKYAPHITLARLRDVSAFQLAAFISSVGPVPKLAFTADRYVMFSSRDSVGGGPYIVEADYLLGMCADDHFAE